MNYYAAFGIVFLSLGGIYLDNKYHTTYLWTFIGIGLGIIYIIYEILKSMAKK